VARLARVERAKRNVEERTGGGKNWW